MTHSAHSPQPGRAKATLMFLLVASSVAVGLVLPLGNRSALAADPVTTTVEGKALIARDPTNARSYLQASLAARRANELMAATQILEEGRRRALPSADLLLALGALYAEQNRLVEAEETTGQALQLEPDNCAAHVQLGDIHNRAGDLTEAASCYRQALALDPANPYAQCHLIYSLLGDGAIREAEATAQQFLVQDRNRSDLWLALGEALEKQDKLRAAFSCYGKVLALDEVPAAHSRRGRIYCRFGQYEEAAVECRSALAHDPEDALAHAYLGIACAKLGQKDEARDHALKAEAAGLNMDAVWNTLAR